MVDPTIKARLVLDTSGGGGGGMAGAVSGGNGGTGLTSAISDKLTIPITDILGTIADGIKALVRASPVLEATMKEFGMGIRMILMPIGETVSTLLRPWILRFNRIAFKFYEDYLSGGFIHALKEAITGEDAGAVAGIAGTIIIGGALLAKGVSSIMGLIASTFGLGTVATTGGGLSLAVSAAVVLSSGILGDAFLSESGGFIGAMAALVGLGVVTLTGATGLSALAIALPVVATLIGSAKISEVFSGGEEGAGMVGFIAGLLGLGVVGTAALAGGVPIAGALAIAIPFALVAAGVVGASYGDYKKQQKFMEGAFGKPEWERSPMEAYSTGYQGTIVPQDVQERGKVAKGMFAIEDSVKESTEKQKGFWSSLKDTVVGFITGGADTNASSGESTGGDNDSMVGAISGFGTAVTTTTDETVVPAFERIGASSDTQGVKVDDLKTKVESLPNINRTITYTIKYERA